jgi:SHS2 domain-containing protein
VTTFEILAHTADTGFRVTADTFEDLLAAAGAGLADTVMDCRAALPIETIEISAQGDDRESLVVNFLNEVLFALDGRHFAVSKAAVTASGPHGVTAALLGEPRNDTRHPPRLVVKAVTYHQLVVEQRGTGWIAEVYLDI